MDLTGIGVRIASFEDFSPKKENPESSTPINHFCNMMYSNIQTVFRFMMFLLDVSTALETGIFV